MVPDGPDEADDAEQPRPPARLDGRTARRVRTRARIVSALHGLVLEGTARPTAESIAQRAEVSLRTIYQHFSDLNDLFSEFAAESLRGAQANGATIDPSASVESRVADVVQQRDRLYADIAGSARIAFALEGESREVAEALQAIRRQLKAELAETFAAEIASVEAAEREQRLEACMILLSFASYDLLRTRQSLPRSQYLRTLKIALIQLLKP